MNMLFFKSNKVFQDKYNGLQSPEDHKSLEDYKSSEDYNSLEYHKKHRNYKTMKSLGDYKVRKSPKKTVRSKEARTSRVLEDGQTTRLKKQYNNL
jgi:hypothetical protein